jgi:hypothetical protein
MSSWYLIQAHPISIGGGYPDQGLPGIPGRPDQGLPWAPGRPDQGLPWAPGRPDQGLPWVPARPDQGLPGAPPLPGQGLPWVPARPDQGLPWAPGLPGTLPTLPGVTPHGTAIATAPPATVDTTKGAWVLVNVQGTLVWAWAQQPPSAATLPAPGGTGATGAPAPKA